jgi:shikimate kinase
MNIILCGMPGSGKSYFGKMAAKRLNRAFIDTDELVVAEYSLRYPLTRTCREIALKEGITFFRELESEVVKQLRTLRGGIIATGGGILCTPRNIETLKSLGTVIYLKVSPVILLERLSSRKELPSYIDEQDVEGSFNKLLNERVCLYETHADLTINVSSDDVVEIIRRHLR